jgi:hypothetical protein
MHGLARLGARVGSVFDGANQSGRELVLSEAQTRQRPPRRAGTPLATLETNLYGPAPKVVDTRKIQGIAVR